jgi:hypothetical protein
MHAKSKARNLPLLKDDSGILLLPFELSMPSCGGQFFQLQCIQSIEPSISENPRTLFSSKSLVVSSTLARQTNSLNMFSSSSLSSSLSDES